MFFALVVAIALPFIGYFITRMPNIDTGKMAPVRDSFHSGVGGFSLALGIVSLMVWGIALLWSTATETPSTVIDLKFCLIYAISNMALGGLVMALTRPRHT